MSRFFESQMHFPVIQRPRIWKFSKTIVGYIGLAENSANVLRRDKALRSLCIIEVNPEGLGW